jgi:uncharacterized membrane protein
MNHEINEKEWQNPDNWGAPFGLGFYFSKKDSRVWVPKRYKWMGWTLNMAKTASILWIIGFFIVAIVTPTLLHKLRSLFE